MKVSKAQKLKNRASILAAAIELSKDRSLKEISMKSIAQKAGLSDAAIYNYFSTKEEIYTGYFEDRIVSSIKFMNDGESTEQGLKYQIQSQLEHFFESVEGEAEFLKLVYHNLVVQPVPISQTGLASTRKAYLQAVLTAIDGAIERKEINEPPFKLFICELTWDIQMGLLYYWLNDRSENKMNTSQVIELGLSVFEEVLRGELFSKAYELMHFLFKEHLLGKLFNLGMPRE